MELVKNASKSTGGGGLRAVVFAACMMGGGLASSGAYAQTAYFPNGFGSAGKPDSWAYEQYTAFQHNGTSSNTGSIVQELAYFTPVGLTGTTRDQFEFYGFNIAGVTGCHGAPCSGSGWGLAGPELGVEYYYQVIQPTTKDTTSTDYVNFWTSPDIQVNFPNGNNLPGGFGGGGNEFSYNVNWQNYLQIGPWKTTFVPIYATYSDRPLSSTYLGGGVFDNTRNQGGWSISTGIVNAQYQLTPDFSLGIYNTVNFSNIAGTIFKETTTASIGPAWQYNGFGKYNLYLQGTVLTNYIRTNNAKQNTSVIFYLFQYLN